MGSQNHIISTRSLLEEDANLSTFRRRNKIIILLFLFLIILLAIIIAAFILEHVRLSNTSRNSPLISPIKAFCSLSDADLCFRTLYPITRNKFISDPNQIFTIALQTAAKDLQQILLWNLSDSDSAESAFRNCSNSLRHGFNQIRHPLVKMRVNPFVESLSGEERGEMMKQITAAEEDVAACLDDLAIVEPAAVGAVTAELNQVRVYLNAAGDFVSGYAKVLFVFAVNRYSFDRGIIFENVFSISMFRLQLVFMFGMFVALYRIR